MQSMFSAWNPVWNTGSHPSLTQGSSFILDRFHHCPAFVTELTEQFLVKAELFFVDAEYLTVWCLLFHIPTFEGGDVGFAITEQAQLSWAKGK